jgi:hypothetical protein
LSNSTTKNLFLIESSVLPKINNLIPKNSQIISFDYESHQYFEKSETPHMQSEELLSDFDLEKINSLAKNLSKWSKEEIISNFITYENLNLGDLFTVEFHYFILPLIKKFLEIQKIISKFPNTIFHTTGILSNIIEFLGIKHISKITEHNPSFLYDDIQIKTPFLNFNLSRTKFNKFKNFSENLSHFLPSKSLENSCKNILFIEFDLERYESLFTQSKKYQLNLIIHNRRRPLYYNPKSFQIFRNSNCIDSFNNFNEKNIDNKLISKITSDILNNIRSHNTLFTDFFKIDNFSIWEIIRPSFLELCEKRIRSALLEFFIANQIFENQTIDKIVLLSENGFNEQIFLVLGKKFDVEICLLQHGIFLDDSNALDHNIFSGIVPIKSDKILGWGEISKTYFSNIVSDSKIETVGYPGFDKYLDSQNSSEKYVLLTTTAPRKIDVKGYLIKYLEKYENSIFHMCSILSQQGKKIIIKTHPFMDEHQLPERLTKLPSVQIKNNSNVLELIRNSELVIVFGISTIALEAQILGKPIIFYENDYDLGTTTLTRSKLCMLLNDNNFESNVSQIFNDSNVKSDLIQKGDDCVKQYLSNLGFASKKTLDYFA